ncbi:MFS transporter [Modestobacter roseus]|uniref:Putative MFS family arabinose efflux permease n=1 Tax=Modestobacter roseus TaxID=1181884 RepID=A0A562IR73_9ACTN|nr:MFS transporter [Modestobacter roseus]TWH73527.1 putative MFS family arabinose efflux permease [Modestobacter roseus]
MKRSLQSRPVDRPAALVVPGLAVIAVTYGLARYGFGLYLPQFRDAFGISPGTAGGIAAAGYLAYCLAAAVAQRLTGRARARTTLWLAGGAAALGSLLVAAAWSVPALAVGALLAGSGAGAATPALVAAVAATVRPDAQPRAQAVVNSGTGVGVVVGGLLVLSVPDVWRPAWAGFAVAAVLVTAWADRSSRWPTVAEARPEVPVRALARPLVAALVAGAGCAAVWTFARDLMTADGGLPAGTTGLLWCVLGGAGLVGGLSGDLVVRFGLRRAWLWSTAIAAAATALLAALPGAPVVAGVALGGFGAAFVALSGVLIVWGGHRLPAAAPQAAAVLFIALTVGQAVGALVLGAVAGATGLRTAFGAAAVLVLVAAPAAERAARQPGS